MGCLLHPRAPELPNHPGKRRAGQNPTGAEEVQQVQTETGGGLEGIPGETWVTGLASSLPGTLGFIFIINYYFGTDTFSQDISGGCVCACPATPDVAKASCKEEGLCGG